ncbi:Nicotinamide adenine dinucleotide transporter 2, mitochondrial, partial [Linum perenne]
TLYFMVYLGDVITSNNIAIGNASAYCIQAIVPTRERWIQWATMFGNHEWLTEWFLSCPAGGADYSFKGARRVELMRKVVEKDGKGMSFSRSSSASLWSSVSNYVIPVGSSDMGLLPVLLMYFLNFSGHSSVIFHRGFLSMTEGRESKHNRTRRELVCHAGAGAAAGAIAATFVCPLDVIKTRLQVHGLPVSAHSSGRGSAIISILQNVVKTEGFRGLYRGLSPTILAILPNWAVYFTVYEKLKGLLLSNGDESGQLTVGRNMIAAAGAGAATAISTNPLWVVKTRLQTQGMRPGVVPYTSICSALRRITCEEGLRGLYSGILPSLAGVSHVAIQFPAYEKIKSYMAKRGNTSVDKLNTGEVAVASSIAKVVASVTTYPHEVIRSRLQEQGQVRGLEVRYAGVVDCARKVFLKEGITGFYRGCATNLMRTTPSAVITFTSYEMIHRMLERVLWPEKEHSDKYKGDDGRIDHDDDEKVVLNQPQTHKRTSSIHL